MWFHSVLNSDKVSVGTLDFLYGGFMFSAHCSSITCMMLRQWSAFVSHSFSFPRTSVYDSRARERLRQIEEQKALALQLQNQVKNKIGDKIVSK